MIDMKMTTKGPIFNKFGRVRITEHNLRVATEDSTLLLTREVKLRTPVRKGTLRRSINSEVRGSGLKLQGIVGTPLKYAPVVEEGRQAFKPFPGRFMFRDGLAASESRIIGFYERAGVNIARDLG